jgi:hypothetical protein
VAIEETKTLDALWFTRQLASEELACHGGWLFGLPGDGVFALFESAVDAVRCALRVQARLAESPKLHALKLRIGLHLGDVLFHDELPYGEVLVIASRLESLAEPGGILVSASVMDAVASHVMATFSESGVAKLKNTPRHIETFRVLPAPSASEPGQAAAPLDRTLAPEPASLRGTREENTPAVAASPKAPAAALDDASLGRLALLLTTHLGPMANLLVRRKATEIPDPAKLILMLAQEIPAEGERRKFLIQARAAMAEPK